MQCFFDAFNTFLANDCLYGILDNGLGSMYVPFDFLFKKLVGSRYYEGNITKMKRLDAGTLYLHAESYASEPLLYALRKYYPNLDIKL